MDIKQACNAHKKGQYELAEAGYTAYLQKNSNHADTLHLLGCVKKQQNKYVEAIQCIEKAIEINPKVDQFYYNLGLAYYSISKIEKAMDAWKQSISLNPSCIDAYANIGYAFTQQDRFQEAQDILMQGYEINPKHQSILLNLAAACHRANDFQKARHFYEELLSVNPSHVQALKSYGHLLYKTGNLIEAINSLLYLTDIQPDCADNWYLLGCAYQDNFQDEDAIKCFKQVLSLDSNAIKACYNLGRIEEAKGHLTSAKKYYLDALKKNPNFSEVLVVLGTCYLDMADYDNAQFYIQKALENAKEQYLQIGSIHLYSLNFMPHMPELEIYQNHLKWGNDMIAHCNNPFNHIHKKNRRKKIRIGYVSPDFRRHSVVYFILPILKYHDPNQFKIYIYSNVMRPDEITDKIRKQAHEYRNICGMNTNAAAKLIIEDQLDILIDLAGHTLHNRLDIFAMKPAPIQITYLGYPGTSGLTTIDYRITDNIADPVDTLHYTEKLIRIAPPFVCYQPPDNAPEPSDLPMNQNGYITFGSFNYLGKINDNVIQLWIELLKQIPNAQLVLKSRPFHDSQMCKRFQEMFISKGISQKRLNFRGSTPGLYQHLSHYHDIDIALDPFPYNGTTTTCEALWMGVPVLTIAGNVHSERVGTVLMKCLGLDDWVTIDEKQFIRQACLFSEHPHLLSKLRRNLRHIMCASDLCNGALHAKKMESVYKKVNFFVKDDMRQNR
jgi:predicted O-linked N-acetylglucosamine transferase (SPINDLY family)